MVINSWAKLRVLALRLENLKWVLGPRPILVGENSSPGRFLLFWQYAMHIAGVESCGYGAAVPWIGKVLLC